MEELKALFELAHIGDIRGVEQEALRLQVLNSQYLPFTQKILLLAQEFDDHGILNLINPSQ
ncbi:MAG: hypothetical protein SAK29_05935 [Scytonema sp. PMC 1069.18]|nr:hypothetical protein [Scytonema sp. PMC 1069.18]MEC4882524.1 hypothetical protein [Scytonema sp. PMC 1070.18]